MTKDIPNRKSLYFALGFALLTVVVYLTGLSIPFLGPDEPRYSQVAREMFERGDWVTPTLGGFDWFEKPALLYWMQIVFYNIFGVSEFAARFGPALFGLGTIFFLWLAGREVRETEGEDFAGQIAIVAASTLGLMAFSRGASFDITLTFPITASLVSFFIWDNRHREARTGGVKFLALFFAFAGLAMLAKGLVGILFPYAIVAFYFLLSRRRPPTGLIFAFVWGTALCGLVASAWYVPMYLVNGWKFIDDFFIQHHFQRYTSNKYLHPQPFWFFWAVYPLMTLPWMPFFFAAVWRSVKRVAGRDRSAGPLSPLTVFAFSWMLVPLVFFSFSGSKLPGYILPALPAGLILTSLAVLRFVRVSQTRRKLVVAAAVLTMVVSAGLARFVIADFIREETVWHLVMTANDRGYKTEKIVNLHTISHSLEYYGAGRLVRLPDGKQRKLFGVTEVVEEMDKNKTNQILVIIPLSYLDTLTSSNLVRTEVLDDNGEHAIVIAKRP